jgi:hypothetical protein
MEQENKKLKDELDYTKEWLHNVKQLLDVTTNDCVNLEKENKKLKDELYIWKLTARDYARLQWVNLPELSDI